MKDDIQVLMLEQDADDRHLTEEMLHCLGYSFSLRFFSNSDDLFAFLQTAKKKTLLLIDYNNSHETGLEILKRLKAHEDFKKFPVAILSDSALPNYKEQCYANGASSFIKKPATMEDTKRKIALFFRYWFEVVEV